MKKENNKTDKLIEWMILKREEEIKDNDRWGHNKILKCRVCNRLRREIKELKELP